VRFLVPVIIVVVGLLALFIVLPATTGVTNPATGNAIETRLGLDLQGGLQLQYDVLPLNGKQPTSQDVQTEAGIIEQRVNATGATEPRVYTQGNNRIVVEIPGATDVEATRKLVGSTGKLDFVPLPPATYGTSTTSGSKPVPQPGEAIDPSLPILFSGDQIASVSAGFDSTANQYVVNFALKDGGKKLLADYSTKNVGNFFAIVLDGKVVMAPYIRNPITDGSGQISGNFTAKEQQNLITVLRYGALPFPLQEQSVAAISATLGADFLRQSLIAGLIGIVLVLLFMLVYYRLPGAVACFALIYYAIVVLAVFRLIPVTLTLAGIAGFVLSVGMAVDANILIFERTREELRAGKTLQPAIEAGFNRAWPSIFDSNVSSLITATILFYFGTSVIRGFALVLIIGVLTSMFTAVTVSRTVLRFVVRSEWTRQARLWGVSDEDFNAVTPRTTRPREARVGG